MDPNSCKQAQQLSLQAALDFFTDAKMARRKHPALQHKFLSQDKLHNICLSSKFMLFIYASNRVG